MRVGRQEVAKLLKGSGRHYGVFWRDHSWDKGGETHEVVWLKKEVGLDRALKIEEGAKALGVVYADARYGIRVTSDTEKQATTAKAGDDSAPPRPEKTEDTYTVDGARYHEHGADIVQDLQTGGWTVHTRASYLTGNGRRFIVGAESPPPFDT